MKVVIIGGERIPYFIAKSMIAKGYDVYIVNKDPELCDEFSKTLNATIVEGDATTKEVLDQLELSPKDIVVLLTERDRKNFFIARMVQEYYSVKNIITFLNNSENEELFEKFGIKTIKVTDILLENIENAFIDAKLSKFLEPELASYNVNLLNLEISEESKIANKKISELNLKDTVIGAVIRQGAFIIPKGDTVLISGDKVLLICTKEGKENVLELFE